MAENPVELGRMVAIEPEGEPYIINWADQLAVLIIFVALNIIN